MVLSRVEGLKAPSLLEVLSLPNGSWGNKKL